MTAQTRKLEVVDLDKDDGNNNSNGEHWELNDLDEIEY
jgi:hypothetical protein